MDGKKRMPCPLNEFSEHCTADMADMDTTYREWLKPQWKEAREKWEKKIQSIKDSYKQNKRQ